MPAPPPAALQAPPLAWMFPTCSLLNESRPNNLLLQTRCSEPLTRPPPSLLSNMPPQWPHSINRPRSPRPPDLPPAPVSRTSTTGLRAVEVADLKEWEDRAGWCVCEGGGSVSALLSPAVSSLPPFTPGVFHKECVITAFVGFSPVAALALLVRGVWSQGTSQQLRD
ncbi:unnamed protein product [Pleuronectes platessa]|uniref:Uncharacterized protein n=1 Tax=Pleuronectes platessa TaxID=8262 RepID=A0A9N7VAJ1_PLEPL|nr:unnamed protein product [Pleuronectes platessa]